MNRYFKTLELHKILEMLSNEASNLKTKELALDLKPVTDIDIVKNEMAITTEAVELSIKYGSPSFSNFKDITGSIKRAQSGSNLNLKEILEIKQMLYQIRQLSSWYNQCDNIDTDLSCHFLNLAPNKYLEDKISNTIIDEDEIADTASSELASIRRKMVNSGIKIRETLDKMIKSTTTQKYLQENIVTIREGRYVLPVKVEHKGEINGLVHDTSGSGSTLFIEPMAIVEANNDIKVLKRKEQDEIERIIAEISAECASFGDAIIENYNDCVQLNLYFAKASLALKMDAMTPMINSNGYILLKKARHPLIDRKTVVPVDIELGDNYDTLVITGPNTGGKTVVLKTVGLLISMTMCGLLIPVSDGSEISIFNNILVDIGDQQSIEQSLSTFSSHMNRVIEILDLADSSSLVLLDELGSGTDPIEGAALAISIIEKLNKCNVKMITTTHYQELKMYAIDTPRVENASCEFDIKTLMPTYKLIIGSPGKSNAFAISSKLGLSEDIIQNAKSLLSNENTKFETIMDQLELNRVELEKNNRKAKKYKDEIELLKSQLEKEREKFNEQKEKEFTNARQQASRIVEKVKRESEKLIDELDQLRKDKEKENFTKLAIEARAKNRGKLNKLYLEANPVSQNNDGYKLPRALKVGDNVLITDTNKNGVVMTEVDSSGKLFIQVGIMKTKIHISKLRLIEKEKVTLNNNSIKQNVTKITKNKSQNNIKTEIDIRGFACDEAIPEVDMFLDDSVMAGINIVTIIHGKGTGVLKNAIRQHFKKHPQIKSYRKGVYGEGEDGVTVVELK